MNRIYMIGNTHFDPVWLWEWDEALSSITATFRSALSRMDEYPDFTYSFSAPAVLEWIENTDPDLFLQIKQRVKEGRWELCEAWWLQPDCFTASGESYVRQGLYAERYLMQKFGKTSDTVFNIDSFGHPVSLVQILNGCGIKNYVFWRPNEKHMHLDSSLFTWLGKNGTSVRAYRLGSDGGGLFKPDIEKDTLDPAIAVSPELKHNTMLVYGVTDHGGAPTVQMINAVIDRKSAHNIDFGRVDEFFENADMSGLPTLSDDLFVNFIGPYSNFTEVKKNNRRAEYALLNAEKASVIANRLIGRKYDKETLRACWKDVMFDQFHDILGGCCIESAYTDARDLHGRAVRSAREITHFSLQSVTNKIKMPGKNPDNEWNLVLWNLNGFDFKMPIEAEVQWAWEFDWYGGGITLVDEDGHEYKTQIITERSVVPRFRSRFVFEAELPALGYKSFIVKKTEDKGDTPSVRTECDVTGLFKPYAVYDECDTWGFNKTVYGDKKHYLNLVSDEITEDGAVRRTHRLVWEFNRSTVVQNISLYSDRIECRYRVLWNEERYALKFEKSVNAGDALTVSEPYGSTLRAPSVYERPMGEWIMSGDTVISADSVFSYNFDGKSIGLTILRNCIFGDLRTEPLDEKKHYPYMGQGVSEGRLLVTFDGSPDAAASAFNNPPIVMCEANHGGEFPPSRRFLKTDDNCLVTAVKMAEDGENYVLRAYSKEDAQVAISLFDNAADITVTQGEVITLKAENGGFTKTNMLER